LEKGYLLVTNRDRLPVCSLDGRNRALSNAGFIALDLSSHRYSSDPELRTGAIVTLSKDPDDIGTILGQEPSGGSAGSTLESVAVHSSAVPDVPLFDTTAVS